MAGNLPDGGKPEPVDEALDLLMQDLPEEDELDVDFDFQGFLESESLGLKGASAGDVDAEPSTSQGSDEEEGDEDEDEDEDEEGTEAPETPGGALGEPDGDGIFKRTRTHVALKDVELADLERPLRVALTGNEGDWEEGGREYMSYVNFLETLNNDEDESLEDGSEEEEEEYNGFDASIFGRRHQTRQATKEWAKRVGLEFQPVELPNRNDAGHEEEEEVDDEADDEIVRLFARVDLSDSDRLEAPTTSQAGEAFTGEQLRQLYFQLHSHTQLLLQTLDHRYDPNAHAVVETEAVPDADGSASTDLQRLSGDPTPSQEMLQDVLRQEQRACHLNRAGIPFRIWEDRKDVEKLSDSLTELHLDYLSEEEPLSIWSNSLVAEIPTIVYSCSRDCLIAEGSGDPIMEELGEYLNLKAWEEQEAEKGELRRRKKMAERSLKRHNKKQQNDSGTENWDYMNQALFSPAEDELLARGVEMHSLRYDLIHQNYVIKTPKQIRQRINNLMNRCKGNAVEVMVKHMREKPLDESEVRMIKSGMEKHGPTGFRGIHGDHPRLGREVGYLKRLWENHIESNEQDRLFMQRLVAKAEEEERARDAAKEDEKRRKREAKEKERLEAKLQRQREREEKRKVKEQQELHLKKVREEKKRAREEKKRQDLASKLARPKGSKQVAVEQGPPLGTSQDYHLAGDLGARYWCGENDERAEPASFSGGWSKELDRIILLSVKTHGESDTAFHSAWNQMGGEVASPFSIEEVTQRWHWLCAKFMEGELTTAS